jgi:WD40 repeat protein
VNCVAFTPDGSKIIVAGMGGARLFNARDGGLLDVEFLSAFVENTATSSDGTKLFCADSSYLSKVWDLNTGEELLAVDVGRGARSAPAVAFSPDGRRVAAGFASDGHTAVWEVPEGKQP